MTSQAVMKRYINALAKKNQSNAELQKLSTAILNFKKLTKEQQGKVNKAVEIAYEKLQAKGVSAKKVVSKPASKPSAKKGEQPNLKTILSELKDSLGASKFKEATSGTTISKDIKLAAYKKGKRIVRNAGYTTNAYGTFKNKVGSTYYENRANRYDANQPSTTRKYKLAKGGEVDEIKVGDKFNTSNGSTFYIDQINKQDSSYPYFTIKSKPTDYPEVIHFDEFNRYLKNGFFEKVDGKFAKGGFFKNPVTSSEYLSKEEVERFEDYVYEVYEEYGFTKEQVKAAVKKYLSHLEPSAQKAFTYGGGDSLDRERVYEYLLNPKLKQIKNPTFAKGGTTKTKFKVGDKVVGQFRYEYGEGLLPVSIYDYADRVKGVISNVRKINTTTMYSIKFDNGEELQYPDFAIDNFIVKSQYAKGGLTEHGLEVGDEIVMDVKKTTMGKMPTTIGVKDYDKEFHLVDLDKGERYAKGGETKKFGYSIELVVKKDYGNEGGIIANFVGKGDAMISARALNENSPENYEYSVKESSKMAQGGISDSNKRFVLEVRDGKTDELLEERVYRYNRYKDALQDAKDDEEEFIKKYGDPLHFELKEKYAQGGEVEEMALSKSRLEFAEYNLSELEKEGKTSSNSSQYREWERFKKQYENKIKRLEETLNPTFPKIKMENISDEDLKKKHTRALWNVNELRLGNLKPSKVIKTGRVTKEKADQFLMDIAKQYEIEMKKRGMPVYAQGGTTKRIKRRSC